MKSIIKTLDGSGQITENAIYTIKPAQALVAYLEQTINKNFNTWNYKRSKFIELIKELPSKKGYSYFIESQNTAITAYEK